MPVAKKDGLVRRHPWAAIIALVLASNALSYGLGRAAVSSEASARIDHVNREARARSYESCLAFNDGREAIRGAFHSLGDVFVLSARADQQSSVRGLADQFDAGLAAQLPARSCHR